MLFWIAGVAAAASSEEICVAAERGVPVALAVAAPPESITRFRAAAAQRHALDPVPSADLVRAVPPIPSRGGFRFRSAAAPHPTDPARVLLAVQGAAPSSGVAPIRLTLLIDTSPSMSSVVLRELPPLQDEGPLPRYRAVPRLQLARAALHELVDRLPARAVVSVVAFDRTDGTLLLSPTGVAYVDRIHDAIDRAGTEHGRGSILDLTAAASVQHADLCADNRILLVTDDNARLDLDAHRVTDTIAAWRSQGVELWTLSLGLLGRPAPAVAALTERGGGVHLKADTLTDATEQLAASLRAAGAVARSASVVVTPDPERVRAWRRIDAAQALDGPDTWALPETIEASWRAVALYELELSEDAPPGPVASVTWSMSSPVPGDWTKGETEAVAPTALSEAPPLLRDRAVALLLGEGMAGRSPLSWSAITALVDRLASDHGTAREFVAWSALLEHR